MIAGRSSAALHRANNQRGTWLATGARHPTRRQQRTQKHACKREMDGGKAGAGHDIPRLGTICLGLTIVKQRSGQGAHPSQSDGANDPSHFGERISTSAPPPVKQLAYTWLRTAR